MTVLLTWRKSRLGIEHGAPTSWHLANQGDRQWSIWPSQERLFAHVEELILNWMKLSFSFGSRISVRKESHITWSVSLLLVMDVRGALLCLFLETMKFECLRLRCSCVVVQACSVDIVNNIAVGDRLRLIDTEWWMFVCNWSTHTMTFSQHHHDG